MQPLRNCQDREVYPTHLVELLERQNLTIELTDLLLSGRKRLSFIKARLHRSGQVGSCD